MSNGENSRRGTSPDEGGASTAPHVPRCRISITSTKAALHFTSSGKGSEVFRATLSRERPGHSVRWELSPADDKDTGTVRFADASSIETVVWARHPNRATVRVSYRRPWGTVLCEDSRAISVPQYFWLRYRTSEPSSGFLLDLERLGLRRRPPLSTVQADTNARVQAAVKMEVMATAWRAFDGVNVRFVETDPSAVVLRANVTTVDIGGVDRR